MEIYHAAGASSATCAGQPKDLKITQSPTKAKKIRSNIWKMIHEESVFLTLLQPNLGITKSFSHH